MNKLEGMAEFFSQLLNLFLELVLVLPEEHALLLDFAIKSDELGSLTDQERESLKRSLNDLVCETTSTAVAETRFKKIMKKVGKDGYEGMRSILTDIVSETVRKSLFD